jgi:hypothetical protein
MRTRKHWMIAVGVLLTAVVACSDDDNGGTGTDTDFEALLSGANEVPPVPTEATGSATLTIEGQQIVYQVDVQNIENVLFSHIHIAPEGENGDVRLNLCGTDDTPGCSTTDTGTLVSDSNAVTTGTPAITFDSLVSAIRAGNAYVNVHTTANPGGEIRGQITPQ